jgi:hypothetical protein
VSVALVATSLGAVAGPNLVGPLGVLATAVGVPALAGPFLLAAAAYLAAAVVLFVLLRPDPFLVARELPAPAPTAAAAPARPRSGGVVVGAAVMVLAEWDSCRSGTRMSGPWPGRAARFTLGR